MHCFNYPFLYYFRYNKPVEHSISSSVLNFGTNNVIADATYGLWLHYLDNTFDQKTEKDPD